MVLVPIQAVGAVKNPLVAILIEMHKRFNLERLTEVVEDFANWNQVDRVVPLSTQFFHKILDVRR